MVVFKLVRPALALDIVDGKQQVLTIPTEATVSLPKGKPDRLGLVNVCWEGRAVEMFWIDLTARGVEITEQAAQASPAR